MDEELYADSEKYLSWFSSSWADKDKRGLFDLWENVEQYWEGHVNEPITDSDPASSINIVHSNIEGQVAMMTEQDLCVEVAPVGPSDMAFAKPVKIILQWIIDKNRMRRKLDIHERNREKFGTGIFRVIFNPDYMDGFGLPVIEPCNPAYIFVDPVITDVYKIQEGRFMIETLNRSVQSAKDKYGDIAENIQAGYHPMDFDYIFGEDDGETDDISRDSYLHLLIWMKDKGKLRLVEMSGCGIILSDSDKDEKNFPNDKFPYFFTPLYYRSGTVWGKGDAELLINIQDLVNDIDDQIRINARLTGNPQKLISNSSGIDVDKWTNESGLNIPCNDVMTAYQPVIPPPMAQYPIDRRRYALEYEIAKVTRFSDQMLGTQQKGVDTATEARAIQQQGTAGIQYKKSILQETLSELFSYVLDCVKEFYTEEKVFRVTEGEGEFIWFRGSDLKKIPQMVPLTATDKMDFITNHPEKELPKHKISGTHKKQAEFDIKITVGAGLPQNKAFVYQVISESFAKGAITPQEYRKLLKDYVNLPVNDKPEEVQKAEQQQAQQKQQQGMQPMQEQNIEGAPAPQGGVVVNG